MYTLSRMNLSDYGAILIGRKGILLKRRSHAIVHLNVILRACVYFVD